MTPAHVALLERLYALNQGLADRHVKPLFRNKVGAALDYTHLQAAVDLTEVLLIRVTRVMQEGGE